MIIKRDVQSHGFHLVSPSPWPLCTSLSLWIFFSSLVLWMHGFVHTLYLANLSILLLIFTISFWFRDIMFEGTYLGCHTSIVQKNIIIGMGLFILSEVFFFLAIFWANFHNSFSPNVELGVEWPPIGIETPGFEIPLLNTVLLLSSGLTVTYAHHCVLKGDRKGSLNGLILTILLAILFTALQYLEYINSSFTFSDGVFGSCFYFGTGFHGFHVFIGTAFLTVGLWRIWAYHFTLNHHLGLESAIFYWHFVDLVWLLLVLSLY